MPYPLHPVSLTPCHLRRSPFFGMACFHLWLLLVCALPPSTAQAGITLVREGKPGATIVVGADAVEPAREAAVELQTYLRKITNAELSIVTDDEEIVGPKVLVGESRFTRELGLRNTDFGDQEYMVRTSGPNLILMGRDESDQELGKLAVSGGLPKKFFQRIGSIYAVDTFLQKHCGVRWYLPDDIGEVVPSRQTLEFGSIDLRRRPSTRFRAVANGWDDIRKTLWAWKDIPNPVPLEPEKRLWWARRLKMGGEPFLSCHSFYGYYKRFGATHPEWFAKSEPKADNQLCLSNPEVFKQVVQDARDFFDGKLDDPNAAACGDVFSVYPMDSGAWCQCEKCRPRYDPSRKMSEAYYNIGGPDRDGYASEYVWGFVAAVANEVRKTHPDKYISCGAYWQQVEPPRNVNLPPNVKVILSKFHWKHWEPRSFKTDRDLMNTWLAKLSGGDRLYFWDYYCFPEYTTYEALPSIAPHAIAADIQVMKERGVTGGQLCNVDGYMNLAMEHLRLYTTLQLLDDWDLNVDALLAEYYRLFYGPAEKPMRTFFEKLEAVYSETNPRLKPVIESEPEPKVTITIDLGTVQPIRGVAFSTAAEKNSAVFWPKSIMVAVSKDGRKYEKLGDLVALSASATPLPDAGKEHVKHRFMVDNLNAEGRCVQLQAQARGWYVFCDEIEVYGNEE
ncbi:MAG: DUF4838 domain-containing protein [Verrucomicrobia bacterium]|nr:DUF4838 domain-containing protein [Verrucomicrobiota bacterium]